MPPNPKILQIISSRESGLYDELTAFVDRISMSGFESEICVLAGSNCCPSAPVPTTSLGKRWTFDLGSHMGLRRLLRRFRPDILHTWDSSAQLHGALHCGQVPLIAEKRGSHDPKGWLQRFLDKKTSQCIIPRSGEVPGNNSKTVVIAPAAVPKPIVDPIPADEMLAKLGFPLAEPPAGDYYPVFQSQYEPARRNYKPSPPSNTPYIIGIVLPLCSEHRILDALWVFETFVHVHLNYHVLIIGDGKDRELFLRCRDRWNLFSRVHFLGNRSDAYKLLPSVDVLLHLTSQPEFSGSILSAMSCGTPVIALETPESRELILDGVTGMLIPQGGDFRFYRRTATMRLLYLLENGELRRSMSLAAKNRVAEKYNFDASVQRRIEVYQTALNVFPKMM